MPRRRPKLMPTKPTLMLKKVLRQLPRLPRPSPRPTIKPLRTRRKTKRNLVTPPKPLLLSQRRQMR